MSTTSTAFAPAKVENSEDAHPHQASPDTAAAMQRGMKGPAAIRRGRGVLPILFFSAGAFVFLREEAPAARSGFSRVKAPNPMAGALEGELAVHLGTGGIPVAGEKRRRWIP